MRTAKINRDTLETQIHVELDLDGTGQRRFETGLPFLEHMLDQVARHGLVDLVLIASGDLEIDAHHTVEDIGITIGQAVDQAIGNKQGIRRYGHAYVPLDEALSRVVIDFSGRPGLEYNVKFNRQTVGDFCVELFHLQQLSDWIPLIVQAHVTPTGAWCTLFVSSLIFLISIFILVATFWRYRPLHWNFLPLFLLLNRFLWHYPIGFVHLFLQ